MKLIYPSLFFFCFFISSSIFGQTEDSSAKHEFSVKQCIEYSNKNNLQVKNATLNLRIQEQVNRNVTAAAYPQINGSIGSTYYPNITVQNFPNFIAAGT